MNKIIGENKEIDYDVLIETIENNDVLCEWGADPTLLESEEDKGSLLEYVNDYGVKAFTKKDCDEYEWEVKTSRLDLNRRFSGVIFSTNAWNSENMTFCLDWDSDDALQPGVLDIYETEDLLEEIEDGNVVFWSADGAITGEEAQVAAKNWLKNHDVTEAQRRNKSEEVWRDMTTKLGLPENYAGIIYFCLDMSKCGNPLTALITVKEEYTRYKFGIALKNVLQTEYKDFDSDEKALAYGKQILTRQDVVSVQIHSENKRGWLYMTTYVK